MTSDRLIGVDVGASNVKAAVVDCRSGQLKGEPTHAETPAGGVPEQVAARVAEVVGDLSCDGTVGVALPCVVREGVARLATNMSSEWVGTDAVELLTKALGRAAVVMNDADAAGLAEARFGAAVGHRGTVLLLTFGTGIGSALLREGNLVPNTEFGQTQLDGVLAERRASAATRARKRLSWAKWAKRVNDLLDHLAVIIQPDLIVIGGGVSEPRRVKQWQPHIKVTKVDVRVVPATLANRAGIVGASLHASSPNYR